MLKKISVVTIAKNEEADIAACINSAKGWADECIVREKTARLDKAIILW